MINFATLYKDTHSNSEIPKFIDSNIIFPSIVLDSIFNKIKKFINFGTMMQHLDGINHTPKNFYASTKSSFEMILKYYVLKDEYEKSKDKCYKYRSYNMPPQHLKMF